MNILLPRCFQTAKRLIAQSLYTTKKESAGTQPRHASFIPYVYVRNEDWGYRFFYK